MNNKKVGFKEVWRALKQIPKTITIIRKVDKKGFTLIVMLSMIAGAFPVITLVLSQELINSIVKKSSPLRYTIILFTIYIIVSFLGSILGEAKDYIESKFQYVLQYKLNYLIMDKCTKLTLKDFETPAMYDKIEKITGEVAYKPYQIMIAIIGIITSVEIQGQVVPGWYIPVQNQFSELEQDLYPKGNFNTSLSHGIAGPLIILSDMMANGIIVDGQEEAIIKIIKFLFDFKLNDGERDFWKGQIDFDEVVNKKLTDENIIRRDAWCYGNPGICYAIVSAGNALDNQRLIDYGIENLRLTMNNIKGIFSPTFCHGYAGLYQVLNSVEMLLQKEFFSLEKELLKNKIIDFYNPDYIYGFKNMELDNKMEKIKPYDVCGLLEGTTGVCLSLLEGEKKSDNLWKKAFLLA